MTPHIRGLLRTGHESRGDHTLNTYGGGRMLRRVPIRSKTTTSETGHSRLMTLSHP